jgi:uncharacterized protein (TIGR03083 family)
MTALSMTQDVQHPQIVLDIPTLPHGEAGKLAAVEADRLLALIESLTGDDWQQPTDCTEWTVRDMVAHLAGAVASQARWAEFKRQNMDNPYMKEVEMKIDAINRRQVEDRAEATEEELVAEFRGNAPKAVRTRQRLACPAVAPAHGAAAGFRLHWLRDGHYFHPRPMDAPPRHRARHRPGDDRHS